MINMMLVIVKDQMLFTLVINIMITKKRELQLSPELLRFK